MGHGRQVNEVSYGNGRIVATDRRVVNEAGDTVTHSHESAFGNSTTSYRYTYDPRQNWTRRDEIGNNERRRVSLVREITYWE
jgi:hypothetical protein